MYQPCYEAVVVHPPSGYAYQVLEVPDDWELRKYPEVQIVDPEIRQF